MSFCNIVLESFVRQIQTTISVKELRASLLNYAYILSWYDADVAGIL